MSYEPETPFENIECSKEFVDLLAEAIEEAKRDVDADITLAVKDRAERRKEALQLVAYNLAKLSLHITASRRILNDLRTLRRLLLAERPGSPAKTQEQPAEETEAHVLRAGG